jgi:hypothetical protein
MRTTFITLISLLVIALFASAQERNTAIQQRGVSVEKATSDSGGGTVPAGREVKGKKYAVLVGVTEYQHMTNLRFTKNDAEDLRDQLLAIGFAPDDVRTLTNGSGGRNEPTKQNIDNAVRDILSRAGDGDLVLVFLSGHGTQPDSDPLFCPSETDRNNLPNTTVSINNIRDNMGKSNASFKLLIVDACRENSRFEATMEAPIKNTGVRTIPVSYSSGNAAPLGFKGVTLESVDTNAPLKNLTVFQSCSPGEFSWEDGKLHHGIVTHFIVEGLRGRAANRKGDITMDGLLTYAITETPYYVEESIQKEQNPWRAGEGNDFVLANINRNNLPSQRQEVPRVIRRITTLDLPQQPNELPAIPDGKRRINVATTKELLQAVNPSNLRDGDVIVLQPGVYTLTESLNMTRSPLDKRTGESIVLYGDPGNPQGLTEGAQKGVQIVEDSGIPQGVQIIIKSGRINITRDAPICLIGLDISSTNDEGVRVDGGAEVDILFCSIRDCKGDGVHNRANIVVDSSVMTHNGNGFQSSGRSDVNNSRIANNQNNGIVVSRTAKGRFSDNILFENLGDNWRVLGIVQN